MLECVRFSSDSSSASSIALTATRRGAAAPRIVAGSKGLQELATSIL